MTPADIAIVTKVLGPVVREFTAQAIYAALAPVLARNTQLEERVLELETRPPLPGPAGLPGMTGRDGAPGERGCDGVDGKDGAPGERGCDGGGR